MISQEEWVLASASPRRVELLSRLGISFRKQPSHSEEPSPRPNEKPEEYAIRSAAHKAEDVQSTLPHNAIWLLAADTIVVLDDHILGKPTDEDHAFDMLSRLQGRSHEVYTAFALYHKQRGIAHTEAVQTRVWFRPLTPAQIRRYIATSEPMDKAGAYGIQGRGSALVRRVEGCYFNVVGLPLNRLAEAIEDLGAGQLI